MAAVEVRNLSFKYKNSTNKILHNLSFIVEEGETVVIKGQSGCGKSTLLNCICGLIPNLYEGELTGDIFIWGKNIKDMTIVERVTNMGIIFQNPATQLFSPTIEDELAFGPENLCIDREEIKIRMNNLLKILGMESLKLENPNNLSGGQQQLIAIASVLMLEPKIILCDEIMSWLDEDSKIKVLELLISLKNKNKTIIMTDHQENLKIPHRTILLEGMSQLGEQ